LICEECGSGPIEVVQEDDQVIVRCSACHAETLALVLASADEATTLREEEQARLNRLKPATIQLYDFLRRYHRRFGYAPSVREMQLAMGWSSPTSAAHHLRRLESVGLIERDYAATRGIRLVHAA
jgi:hypothetical protein